jgi:hypothetical protein
MIPFHKLEAAALTTWKMRSALLHSQLKKPTFSTFFQRLSEGVGNCDFWVKAGGDRKMMAIQTTKGVTAAKYTPCKWQF